MMVAFIAAIYSLSNIIISLYGYYSSRVIYDEIKEIHENGSGGNEGVGVQVSSNKLKEMQKINSDYIGWIKIDDTKIDYPIVKGQNNNFYLTHNLYKKADKSGCIFMDYRNSNKEMDKNIIIYGHNMKDKTMFNSLNKYIQKEFLDTHRLITLEFLGDKYKFEVFSVYRTTEEDWINVDFKDNNSFNAYYKEIKSRSILPTNSQPENAGNILTLSSCTGRNKIERVVVHAILRGREGD